MTATCWTGPSIGVAILALCWAAVSCDAGPARAASPSWLERKGEPVEIYDGTKMFKVCERDGSRCCYVVINKIGYSGGPTMHCWEVVK